MVLITWLKKTVVGPFVHGGVRGGRGVQIERWIQWKCQSGGKSTWPDKNTNLPDLSHTMQIAYITLPNIFSAVTRTTQYLFAWPSSYRATRSNRDTSPCLIRFVSESAQNHARTDETVPLLFAARAWAQTEPPKLMSQTQGRKTHTAWLRL